MRARQQNVRAFSERRENAFGFAAKCVRAEIARFDKAGKRLCDALFDGDAAGFERGSINARKYRPAAADEAEPSRFFTCRGFDSFVDHARYAYAVRFDKRYGSARRVAADDEIRNAFS